jgi:hypothetical protein
MYLPICQSSCPLPESKRYTKILKSSQRFPPFLYDRPDQRDVRESVAVSADTGVALATVGLQGSGAAEFVYDRLEKAWSSRQTHNNGRLCTII